jgi:hypothetical protein
MSALKWNDCENVPDYPGMIQGYMNNLNFGADSATGSTMMPKSEHTYYAMTGVPNDDIWRLFTQLIYNRIDKLADKPEEVIMKMKAHEARLKRQCR